MIAINPDKEYPMKRMISLSIACSLFALTSLLLLSGCDKSNHPKDAAAQKKDKVDPHSHEAGPHGGPIADWDEKFHAEFTLNTANKEAVVFILDDKAKAAPKIEVKKISKVKLNVTSVTPILQLDLVHDPKRSDDKGIAYVATHDHFAKDVEIRGAIDGSVEGYKSPMTGSFTYKPADKAKQQASRELYLKPGGIYTAADIKANGTQKPKDLGLDHVDPVVGDKICPVTGSKAHKEYQWVTQGQTYEFCCPPCVDTFLRWANKEPDKIKDAKEYVKRM
jgi:hypothetical protein